MKKILIFGLIAISMLLFSACSSKDNDKEASTTKESTTSKTKEKSSKKNETDSEVGVFYAKDGSIIYQLSEDSLGLNGSKSIKSQIDFSQ